MATVELPTQGTHDEHDQRVAHHFESSQQQFDAGKLGMWLFLVNEVLFFSGLFVAYAVYRANHPEVFVNAHKYLNTTLGAFNTLVLLISSLTMAWAVRSAQLNQKRALVWLLAATLSCASLFLGVKAVEYSHKWDKGLLWAGAYAAKYERPTGDNAHADADLTGHGATHSEHSSWLSKSLLTMSFPFGLLFVISVGAFAVMHFRGAAAARKFWLCSAIMAVSFFVGVVFGQIVESFSGHGHGSSASAVSASDHVATGKRDASGSGHEEATDAAALAGQQKFTGVFFSIYYAMTGVHALHILAGMGVIAWLLWRAIKLEFDGEYFGPVDYVALYWHLVDLVWVYLFPLLYLIR